MNQDFERSSTPLAFSLFKRIETVHWSTVSNVTGQSQIKGRAGRRISARLAARWS